MNKSRPMKVGDLRKMLSFTTVSNKAEVRVEIEGEEPVEGVVWRVLEAEHDLNLDESVPEGERYTLILRVGEEAAE